MMSWSERVRFFYATTFIMLASIIWTVVSTIIFGGEISFSLFIISLISVEASRYLFKKQVKLIICIGGPIVPVFTYQVINVQPFIACLNVIFIIFISMMLIKEESENISYDRYKIIFIKGVYAIFVAAIVYGLIWLPSSTVIYRAIIMYLVLGVITLRESMGYCYNIKRGKVSRTWSFVLVIFAILITRDFFYNKCVSLVKMLYNIFNFLLDKIIDLVLIIFSYPMTLLYNLISNLFKGKGATVEEIFGGMGNPNNKSTEELLSKYDITISPIFYLIIKILVIVMLIFILTKLARKIVKNNETNKNNEYIEVVENIEGSGKSPNRFIRRIKSIFRKKGSSREEIIYKYGEFVKKAREKGIFEEYMTPKQLLNVVKIKVDNCEEIDEITYLYNEAKFSTHIINCGQEQKVEKYVDNINKKIK
ncbi:hypothetical protein [Clostridium sp.]|uniref:hypothetical protein n=1 Tax=Clostridium sp. TaxID=1506 RepID=UPI0032162BFF